MSYLTGPFYVLKLIYSTKKVVFADQKKPVFHVSI